MTDENKIHELREQLTAYEARLASAIHRLERAMAAEEGPHADAEAEYASDLVALAARDLVHEVDDAPHGRRPVGWDTEAQAAEAVST